MCGKDICLTAPCLSPRGSAPTLFAARISPEAPTGAIGTRRRALRHRSGSAPGAGPFPPLPLAGLGLAFAMGCGGGGGPAARRSSGGLRPRSTFHPPRLKAGRARALFAAGRGTRTGRDRAVPTALSSSRRGPPGPSPRGPCVGPSRAEGRRQDSPPH